MKQLEVLWRMEDAIEREMVQVSDQKELDE